MKSKRTVFIGCMIIFTLILSSFSIVTVPFAIESFYPHLSSINYSNSNYVITHSVKYQVEMNFTLTQKTGMAFYNFKFARLDNRIPNSTYTQYTPPYQESVLLTSNLEGSKPYNIVLGHRDKFNNTYDSFSATLSPLNPIFSNLKPWIKFNQKYLLRLNAIEFRNIKESNIGIYDKTDINFILYCNQSESYYEKEDLSLIDLSNSIVNPDDNPIEKARKISNWISNNIDYNENMPSQEKGALWAYNNLEGDCSEYSSLMITLLRIQGIPARKVTGFLLSNDPDLKPKFGNTWTFHHSELSSNLIGHAWVEYYVPNIGWIACDPTWNYFNKIDYIRLNLNVGANFFFPPYNTVSEFLNPLFSYTLGSVFEYDYIIKITVIESTLISSFISPMIIFVIIIFVIIIGLLFTYYLVKKTKRKKSF
jgi:transglutaminase-like putative cysteine protease